MAKKTQKQNYCSTDEEMMMWCAYRYAIGRKTYVNTLANHIAANYYNRLSPERKQFISRDIKQCIDQVLSFGQPCFRYDGNVSHDNRDALNDLIIWLNENVKEEKDLIGIGEIVCKQKSYSNPEKEYYTELAHHNRTICDLGISDLLLWYNLAQLFNIKDYKLVHYKRDNGEEGTIKAFETWMPAIKENVEGSDIFHYSSRYNFEKIYVGVDSYISQPYYHSHINPNFIIKVEEYAKVQK